MNRVGQHGYKDAKRAMRGSRAIINRETEWVTEGRGKAKRMWKKKKGKESRGKESCWVCCSLIYNLSAKYVSFHFLSHVNTSCLTDKPETRSGGRITDLHLYSLNQRYVLSLSSCCKMTQRCGVFTYSVYIPRYLAFWCSSRCCYFYDQLAIFIRQHTGAVWLNVGGNVSRVHLALFCCYSSMRFSALTAWCTHFNMGRSRFFFCYCL